MYHYTYKIICTEGHLKGHYYLGKHSTNNLDDGYKGSGKIIKDYYKKHPNGYIKQIIQFFDSKEDAFKAEKELIGDLHKTDKLCLNTKAGGKGGWPSGLPSAMKGKRHSEEAKRKMSESRKNSKIFHDVMQSEEYKEKQRKAQTGRRFHLSEEAKRKISEARKGKPTWNAGKRKVWDDKENNIFHYE